MRPCGSTVPRAARRCPPFPAFGALLAGLLALLLLLAAPARAGAPVTVLEVHDAIGPASADYIVRGIDKAAAAGAPLVVIRLDTPGGLDTAMRQIIQAILNAPLPVAVHVAPEGARAASAGTYILYAAHIAAMAPATTLGAATPVAIGIGGMRPPGPPAPEGKEGEADRPASPASPTAPTDASGAKAIHDAAAFIRGLAQLRGRNADWAERAVRDAVSLTADEALAQGVIDVVAGDVDELLARIDGRSVRVRDADRVLATAGLAHELLPPDARQRLLAVIANPSFALVLMMIGLYGLIFEFSQPGFGVAGVTGAICLLLGLFALQMLPVNYAGLALIVLGLALMAAELVSPGFGIFGGGGVIAFVAGALLLFDRDVPGFGVPLGLIVLLAGTTLATVLAAGGMALKARRRPVVSGVEELVGTRGVVSEVDGDEAWVQLHGERWRAHAAAPLSVGQPVRVRAVHGLVLDVEPDAVPTRGHPATS
ncbi:MAG: nodulation protein NfeD [Burkholderiales bacterium]|nr:nodulation protein NfeD [Burkholderiales bacterium]